MLAMVVLLASLAGSWTLWGAEGIRPGVRARVVATDPESRGGAVGGAVVLGRSEQFFVKIAYESDRPVRIWARPFFRGTEVGTMSNASIPHEGKGEALGWFSFIDPGEVDEIRILVGGASGRGEEVSRYRVRITGSNNPAATRSRAAWVDALLKAEKEFHHSEAARRRAEPESPSSQFWFSGLMLGVLALMAGGVFAPFWYAWKWRGGWRVAAAIPAAVMVFIVARIVVDGVRDPTSHNLWPLEILLWAVASLGVLGVLKLARRIVGAGP